MPLPAQSDTKACNRPTDPLEVSSECPSLPHRGVKGTNMYEGAVPAGGDSDGMDLNKVSFQAEP